MLKRLCSILCATSIFLGCMSSVAASSEPAEQTKYNYKLSLESDNDFKSLYGYSGGTMSMKKSYVSGKFGNALQITYPGHMISNAGKRYNGYVLEFKTDKIEVGSELLTPLELMRDTQNLSMWVHTPVTSDHGNGAATSRTIEFIFEYITTEGSKKFSKKFQLPNRGEWEYITLPVSYFKSGSVTMDQGIQDESFTDLSKLTITFPYKDYFGANPNEETLETPWEEPLIIDEFLFDRSTDEKKAITPPSTGEEIYFENANISAVFVNGARVASFNRDNEINAIQVPSYYTKEELEKKVTVEVEAPYVPKTNKNQELSGATYKIEAPDKVPGTGSITVTSASGKIRKNYKVDFIARDGLQPDISGIISENGIISVPVINESSNESYTVQALAVLKNKSGIVENAVSAQSREILAGETSYFDFDFPVSDATGTEIYVFNNEYTLMCAPIKVGTGLMSFTEPNGVISDASVTIDGFSINISGNASGNGTAFAIVMRGDEYIGAQAFNLENESFSESIEIGDVTGKLRVLLVYGNTVVRDVYRTTAEQLAECINEYKAIGNDVDKSIVFFEKYKEVLNLDTSIASKLGDSTLAEIIAEADKDVSDAEQIRKILGEIVVLEVMNKYNSAEIVEEIYSDYMYVAGFDNTDKFFKKYITNNVALNMLFTYMAESDYNSIEVARKDFRKNTILACLNLVNGYGEIEEILSGNEEILKEYLDYSQIRSLGDSDRTAYYKYLAEKGKLNSLGELSDLLESYKQTLKKDSNNSSRPVGNSGVSMVAPVNTNTAVTVEPLSTTTPYILFNDVDESHWAYSAIKNLKELGVVNGRENGSFGKDDSVKREEFVKMLLGAFEVEITDTENVFSDVDETKWYAPYVNTAVSMGIVSGVTDDTFGTGKKITRQDMSVLIARFLEMKGFALDATMYSEFADNSDIADYALSSVYVLKNLGLVSGMNDNSFAPKSEATRAQAAKILYSVYDFMQKNSENAMDISGDDEFSVTARKFIELDIIDRVFAEDKVVTKGEFAEIVRGFSNAKKQIYNDGKVVFADVDTDNPYYNAVRYAYENKYINTSDEFGVDEPITLGEAAIILCRLMGYDYYAINAGGDVNAYYSTALKYEIMPGHSKSIDATLGFGEVLEIFNCASEAFVMVNELSGVNTEYKVGETTPMYHFHKLVMLEGTLSAVGSRSVDGIDGPGKNGIRVGNNSLFSERYDSYRYLGYNVKVYYDEDTEVVRFVEPDANNEVMEITHDRIQDFNGSRLSYYRDEKYSSTRSEKLSKSINRMFNYNYVSAYSEEEVENADTIILIDSNKDGEYDTINVIKESIYYVNQLSSYNGTIYDCFAQPSIKPEEMDSVVVFDESGAVVTERAIGIHDILSVITDKQNKNTVIFISRDEAGGVVNGRVIDDDGIFVTVDETEYELTDVFAAQPSSKGLFEVGTGVSILLDRHGRIAYAELDESVAKDALAYLILAVSEEPGIDPFLRLYTMDGAISDIKLAQRITVNGKKVERDSDFKKLFGELNINSEDVHQLIRYNLNDKNEIRSVKTAEYVDGIDLFKTSDAFTRSADMNDIYYNSTYRTFPGYVRVDSNTMIISVPVSETYMKDAAHYEIKEFKDLKSETFDAVEVYNLSKDLTAGVIVIRTDSGGGKQLTYSSTVAAIKKIVTTEIDEETRYIITLLTDGKEKEFVTASGLEIERQYKGLNGEPVTSILDEGDLIRIATNSSEEITDYHKVFDFDNQDDPDVVIRGNEYPNKMSYIGSKKTMIAFNGDAENPDEDVVSGRIWQGKNPYWFTGVQYSTEFGIVREIYGTTMIIQTYPGTSGSNATKCERYFNLKNKRVYILEDDNEGVRLGSIDDIVPGNLAGEENASRVIISRHNDVPSIVAVIKR